MISYIKKYKFLDLKSRYLRNKNYLFIYLLGSLGYKKIVIKNKNNFINKSFFNKLIFNQLGISFGFFFNFNIYGVGFKLKLINNFIYFWCGFSHIIKYLLKNIFILYIFKNYVLSYSINYNVYLKEIYKLLSIKIYKTYKLKGIFFRNQIIRLKEGKAAYR